MVMSKETRKMMKGLPRHARLVSRALMKDYAMDEVEFKQKYLEIKDSACTYVTKRIKELETKYQLLPRNTFFARLKVWDYRSFIDEGSYLLDNGTPKQMMEWLDCSDVYIIKA